MRSVSQYRFAGIENFRDFGGVPCSSGRLPTGRLFRSAHLGVADASDVTTLETLGIATIIDLRRASERARHPAPAQFLERIVASDDDDQAVAPHLEFLRQGDTTDAAVERFLLDYYRSAPFVPRHINLFTKAFSAFREGPVLIHCTAGKDRTGLLAALIQIAAGVHRDDVMADFLETNAVLMTDTNIARTTELARGLLGRDPSFAVIKAMLGVEARHLEAALAAIEAEAGSVVRFVSQLGGWPFAELSPMDAKS
jgi:protein-tyrosine phosphatase